MDPRIANQRLESLRRHRNPKAAVDIAPDVQRLVNQLQFQRTAVGGLDAAWQAAVPAELAARVSIVSLARGTLSVKAHDAGARFEFDRWARGGGLAQLAKAAGVVIARCKLTS